MLMALRVLLCSPGTKINDLNYSEVTHQKLYFLLLEGGLSENILKVGVCVRPNKTLL